MAIVNLTLRHRGNKPTEQPEEEQVRSGDEKSLTLRHRRNKPAEQPEEEQVRSGDGESLTLRHRGNKPTEQPEEGLARGGDEAPMLLQDSMLLRDSTRLQEPPVLLQDPLPLQEPPLPLLEVRRLRKSFPTAGGRIEVLKGIDLSVDAGQLTMLRGRSGSGKTTLLNLLGGLDRPTEGEVLFRGRPLQVWSDKQLTIVRRREVGFIFQTFALLPLLTAWENVELSLRMAGVPRTEWKERVARCLDLVGLTKRAHHRPFELSGGEQQRVAIAKAIAHRPLLLLADEPTAELDSQMAARVIAIFRNIVEEERIAICMTTHDSTLWEAADVVYQMVDGRVVPE